MISSPDLVTHQSPKYGVSLENCSHEQWEPQSEEKAILRKFCWQEEDYAVALGYLHCPQKSEKTIEPSLNATFNQLADQWRREMAATSSLQAIVLHPAYQRIIGLGKPVVPLLLKALREKPEPWFWALEYITGEHAINSKEHETFSDRVNAWIAWGKREGFL